MRSPDLTPIERELRPLLEVHGVELVALDWMQGPGHGILRITIDHPGGDPRDQDPAKSVTLVEVTNVTRDVSTALDALDLIEGAYTLEIGSPGPERPVQKREDFDRFAGLPARLDVKNEAKGRGKKQLMGVLKGTSDHPEGGYAVHIEVAGKPFQLPAARLVRARLLEVKPAPREKPGKGPSSRRQERLAARERARAINAAHRASRASDGRDGPEPNAAPTGADHDETKTTPNTPAGTKGPAGGTQNQQG